MFRSEIDSFLQYLANELRRSHLTVKAYQLDLGQFERFCDENLAPNTPISEVTKEELRKFLGVFGNHKQSSLRRKIATLRSFFEFLLMEKFILENPAILLGKGLRKEKTLPRTVPVSELTKLFAKFVEAEAGKTGRHLERDRAIAEILFSTGIRVGELCALNRGDVDLRNACLLVFGKGAQERIVPIPEGKPNDALAAYLTLNSDTNCKENSPLFLNRNGNRISCQSVRRLLRNYCRKAEIQRVTPHAFRHTLATLLLEKGTDIRYIQSLLGHSSITTTTIYASVAQNARNRILQENHPRPMLG